MRRMIGGSLFLTAGALAGMASAVSAIELYGATPAAPGSVWQSWEVTGRSGAHPYTLAHFLMSGRFPPAAGQMREFSAQRASDGSILTAGCQYVLTAKPAPAHWWSIALSASGATAASANTIMTSETAIAEYDGTLKLTVSRSPASGNWVRPPVAGGFTVLFTVAEPSPTQPLTGPPGFTIERGAC